MTRCHLPAFQVLEKERGILTDAVFERQSKSRYLLGYGTFPLCFFLDGRYIRRKRCSSVAYLVCIVHLSLLERSAGRYLCFLMKLKKRSKALQQLRKGKVGR